MQSRREENHEYVTQRKISDAAVRKATGKGWDAWFALLDSEGAAALPHKQVARLLHDKGYIASGWWCQMVTVEYERARGKRVLGGTESAGFQIGVQKTLPLSPVRSLGLSLSEPAGRALWLGTVPDLRWEKGAAYAISRGHMRRGAQLPPQQACALDLAAAGLPRSLNLTGLSGAQRQEDRRALSSRKACQR